MKKRLLVVTVIAGFAVFIAVGGYWWTRRALAPGDALWPVPVHSFSGRIALVAGGIPFDLLTDNGRWVLRRVRDGGACLADVEKVDAFLEAVQQARPLQYMGPYQPDLAGPYGLEGQEWGITFDGRVPWSVFFGAKGWRTGSLYAWTTQNEGSLYLVDDVYRRFLDDPVQNYCDMRLVGMRSEDIRRVASEAMGLEAWEAVRKADSFVFSGVKEAVETVDVSGQAMDFYLHVLTGMRALGIVAEPPDVLPPVQLRIRLWGNDVPTPEEVLVYPGDGATFFCRTSRQPGYMVLEKEQVDKLTRSAFDMRERFVLGRGLDGVDGQKITLHRDGIDATFLLGRKEEGWRDLVTGGAVLGLDVITYQLGTLQYERPPIDQVPPEARPWLMWELRGEGGTAPLVLHFYKDATLPPGQCWVRVEDRGPWFMVKSRLVDDMLSRVPAPAPVPEAL